MRYSEFIKMTKSSDFRDYSGKLLYKENDLETYYSKYSKRIKLIRDKRSKLCNGFWRVYPLALDSVHVYIVCPYCGEVHTHGTTNEEMGYEGFRVPHCSQEFIEQYGYGRAPNDYSIDNIILARFK